MDNNALVETLGMLTGDNVIQSTVNQRQKARTDKERLNRPFTVGEGYVYNPETKTYEQVPGYAEWVNQREQAKMNLLNRRLTASQDAAAAKADAKAAEIPETTRRKLADMDARIAQGEAIIGDLETIPDIKEQWVDLPSDALKGLGMTGAANIYESKVKSPQQQEARNRIARYIAAIRKSELGSALTGYELAKGAEWDPLASGITQQEAHRRMKNIVDYLGVEAEKLRGGRGEAKQPTNGPQEGDVVDGYRFLGGNPGDPANWEDAQ